MQMLEQRYAYTYLMTIKFNCTFDACQMKRSSSINFGRIVGADCWSPKSRWWRLYAMFDDERPILYDTLAGTFRVRDFTLRRWHSWKIRNRFPAIHRGMFYSWRRMRNLSISRLSKYRNFRGEPITAVIRHGRNKARDVSKDIKMIEITN